MKTVAELIEWYNKQNETKYHKIEVQVIKTGNATYEPFYDVSKITWYENMLCFYGKNLDTDDVYRYFRIDNAHITRSEV